MFTPSPPDPLDASTLSPETIACLSQQQFDGMTPGPVSSDFQALLDRLNDGIPITARSQLPSLKFLAEFNETLSRPTRLRLKRANQKHYVYAIGLFWVARTMGFTRPDEKRKNCLTIAPGHLESWTALKPEEQYFSLLAAWLHQSDHRFLGDRGLCPVERCFDFFKRFLKTDGFMQVEDCDPRNREQGLSYRPTLYNVALLDGFGLIRVEAVEPKEGQAWSIRSIALTEFGDAIFAALGQMYLEESRQPFFFRLFGSPTDEPDEPDEPQPEAPLSSIPFAPESDEYQLLETLSLLMERQAMGTIEPEEAQRQLKAAVENSAHGEEALRSIMEKAAEEDEARSERVRGLLARGVDSDRATDFDLYYDSFREFVPGLEKTLALQVPEFIEGIFIFKVSLGKAWRRLAIPSMWGLDGVAHVILDAFEFEDMAHLYAFNFANEVGVPISIVHQYADFGVAKAPDVQLGDLPVRPGARLDFNFDFGDDWHFEMLLESIDELDEQTRLELNALKIGGKGDPPPQYPDYDEDW